MLKLSAGGAQVNGDECERSSLTKWRTAFLTEGRVAKMAAGACVPLRRRLIGPVGQQLRQPPAARTNRTRRTSGRRAASHNVTVVRTHPGCASACMA